MHQKDGSVLLAQGHTPGLHATAENSIEHIFRLTLVKPVECSILAPGHITNLDALGWYPEGFDFDYDSLHSATVYGSAQLLFHAEGSPETLTVEEHYYAKRGDAATIDKEIYTLTANEYGEYILDAVTGESIEYIPYYVV